MRNQKVPVPGPTLDTLGELLVCLTAIVSDVGSPDEAFTSENWLVRIYQVRKPDILGRPLPSANAFVRTTFFRLQWQLKYTAGRRKEEEAEQAWLESSACKENNSIDAIEQKLC